MESRAATLFSGGHSDDVDYVSWNPTHPDLFCTSGQKDRRIVFWDARRMLNISFPFLTNLIFTIYLESRYIQQCQMKVSPVQTSYSPDGRSLLYASAGHQLFFMTLGKTGDEVKEEWHPSERDAVCLLSLSQMSSPFSYNSKINSR
jgi:THO complex subunit 3